MEDTDFDTFEILDQHLELGFFQVWIPKKKDPRWDVLVCQPSYGERRNYIQYAFNNGVWEKV